MLSLTLNSGVEIPQIGFGTAAIGSWQADDDGVKDAILYALKAGYRHIDTASIYGNERSVGRAIKESGIAREDIFVVSKVWNNQQGYEETFTAFEHSLERLGLDYLDLYLIHWPVPEQTESTWRAMEEIYKEGRVKALGLSNFRRSDIEQLAKVAEIKPCYNQLEIHPYCQQKELVAYCQNQGIAVSCWSPLGTGNWSDIALSEKPIANELIAEIAKTHHVSPAQVILRWNIQQGRLILPKSETPKNIKSNLSLEGFVLSAAEIESINNLDKGQRLGGDPDNILEESLAMIVPN